MSLEENTEEHIHQDEPEDSVDYQREIVKPVYFGALIIGPSGSGKSTLCEGLQQFMNAIRRNCCIVNLDPANDNPKYDADVNISELVQLDDVMENLKLGPNGGLIYCMEFLDQNFDWLKQKLEAHTGKYFVIDFPGQLELFLNSDSLRNLIEKLQSMDFRLTAVELFDAQYIMDKTKYMSACIYSLMSMINLSLPHLSVLSKIDLLQEFSNLDFKIDFYLDSNDFEPLAQKFEEEDSNFTRKYSQLTKNLCQLLDNYGINLKIVIVGQTNFLPLDVMDQVSLSKLLSSIDKCNGFSLESGGEEQKDLRDRIFQAQELSQNMKTLSNFHVKVEEEEEDIMKKQIELFQRLAAGEITEDEMYAMMPQDRLMTNQQNRTTQIKQFEYGRMGS